MSRPAEPARAKDTVRTRLLDAGAKDQAMCYRQDIEIKGHTIVVEAKRQDSMERLTPWMAEAKVEAIYIHELPLEWIFGKISGTNGCY
jgi:hypothetical protein